MEAQSGGQVAGERLPEMSSVVGVLLKAVLVYVCFCCFLAFFQCLVFLTDVYADGTFQAA